MRGKIARALRRMTGYKPNQPRNFFPVHSATEHKIILDLEASEAAGEPRVRIVDVPKITFFTQSEERALYKATKKEFKKRK